MCYPVCEMVNLKEPLLLIDMSSLCSGGSLFHDYVSDPLLCVRRHITINKMYKVVSGING